MRRFRRLLRRPALRALPAALVLFWAVASAAQEDRFKDAFTDEDLSEKKVGGKWTVMTPLDLKQLRDKASPVAVTSVVSIPGRGKFVGLWKIPEVTLGNRGASAVESARLGWVVVEDGREAVLLEGETAAFAARVEAGAERRVAVPHIFFNRIIKPLLKNGELHGTYRIVVGVKEARFADGSVWRRP